MTGVQTCALPIYALASAIVKTIKIFLFRFADIFLPEIRFIMVFVSFSKGSVIEINSYLTIFPSSILTMR